jgi:hypothetical protein
MLSRILKEYPRLRLLAVTLDNGFYSPVALANARKVAKKLDLEYIVYKPRSSLYKSLYRYSLQNVDEKGSYGTVDRLDGSLNQHIGIRLAAEWNIPLALSGVDWAQAMIMGGTTYFEQPRQDMITRVDTDRIERRSGFKLEEIFSQEDIIMYWDGNKWPQEKIPRLIFPLFAWRPDKAEVIKELSKKKLMLKAHSSPIITNNQVLSIMTAIDIKKIGYCSFEPEFAAMIRYNENDPIYWRNIFETVEFLVRKNLFLTKGFKGILRRLGLTKKDIGL